MRLFFLDTRWWLCTKCPIKQRTLAVPDERADDYLAKARRADIEAAAANDPKTAGQGRGLAETYRNIAASLARLERAPTASLRPPSDEPTGDTQCY